MIYPKHYLTHLGLDYLLLTAFYTDLFPANLSIKKFQSHDSICFMIIQILQKVNQVKSVDTNWSSSAMICVGKSHIAYATKKKSQQFSRFVFVFWSNLKYWKKIAYTILVRPILDYFATLWDQIS